MTWLTILGQWRHEYLSGALLKLQHMHHNCTPTLSKTVKTTQISENNICNIMGIRIYENGLLHLSSRSHTKGILGSILLDSGKSPHNCLDNYKKRVTPRRNSCRLSSNPTSNRELWDEIRNTASRSQIICFSLFSTNSSL